MDIRQMMNSPYLAMMNQAATNMSAMRRGGLPQMSPVQAYQNNIMQQSLFNQRLKQQELEERLGLQKEQANEQALNPYFKFEEARKRGYIPEDMSLEEFEQIDMRPSDRTSVQKNMEMWRALNPNATPEQERAAFAALARPTSIFGTGGGGQSTFNALDPTGRQLVAPEDATRRDAEREGEKAGAKSWADYNATFQQTAPESMTALQDVYDFTDHLLQAFQNEDVDNYSGMIEGRFGPLIDETASYIDTMSTLLTVPALAAAKLNPVTEQEFEAIKSTFANFKRDPEANIGALKAQLNWLRPKLDEMKRRVNYFRNNQTMEGYFDDDSYWEARSRKRPWEGSTTATDDEDLPDHLKIPGS